MSLSRLVRSLFVLFFAVLFTSTSRAQINGVPTPTQGAGHDYIKMMNETVNPANGSVTIGIGVPTPAGRRLALPFSFNYNSSGAFTPQGDGGGGAYMQNTDLFLNLNGWSYGIPMASYILVTKTPIGQRYPCSASTSYTFEDSKGTQFSFNSIIGYSISSRTCLGYSNVTSQSNDFYSASITGIQSPFTITSLDNTKYTFFSTGEGCEATNGGPYSTLPSTIEDRNGNIMTVSGPPTTCNGSFTVADTLGRTVISSSGFGATGNTVTVPGLSTYTVTWGTVSPSDSPGSTWDNPGDQWCNSSFGGPRGTFPVITAVALPNGQQYTFSYDPVYGLLSKITYPNGGYISYTWGLNSRSDFAAVEDANGAPQQCLYNYDTPALTHRYVSFDGSTIAQQQDFTYTTAWNPSNYAVWTTKTTTVTTHDLVNGTTFQTNYTYSPVTAATGGSSWVPTRFGTQVPVEQQVVYQGTSGSTLRTANKTWFDQYEIETDQTVLDNGQTSQVNFTWASGLITEKDEYDFGLTLKRKTVYSYGGGFNQPCKTILEDGTSNRVAETDTYFDGSATLCAAGTPSVVGVSGLPTGTHDETLFGPNSTAPRGNPTSVTSQCFNGPCPSGNSTTTYTFDETGQVLSETDACGNASCGDMPSAPSHTTTFSYADNYDSNPSSDTNAFLTQITDALGHTSKFKYAYSDGQLISSTDANNQVTRYLYNDSLRRLTETDYPDSGKTTLAYNDAPYNPSTPSPSVTTTKAITSSTNFTTLTAFDGLGHTTRSVLTSDPDCPTGDRTDTTYDGLGRVFTVSNPYCSTGDPTYGITTYAYDALGRTLQVTQPDNSTVLTSYTGRATQVQDEGNEANGTQRVTRISQADALGRLTSVCEVSSAAQIGQDASPTACPEDIGGSGFLTSYQYDVLGNLTEVDQGTMAPRAFAYDSLSRLTTATNPESGTITYSYDANGNLSSKTAPAPNIASSTATLVGTQTIASAPDNNTPGSAEAFQVTASASGEVSSLTVYIDAPNTATQLFAGIYSDSSGQPGNLLTQGSSGSLQAGAWNTVEVPPISLTAGTPYWIAILASSGTLAFRDGSGCTSINSQEENLTSLPDTWTSGQSYPTCPLSAYGSGEILNGSTTVTTTYQYDALNRLTQKSYSDGRTQAAAYYYDSYPNFSGTNTVGRLVLSGVSSPVGGCIATYSQYDPMGRVSEEWQYLPSYPNCDANYQMPYGYDFIGDITSYNSGYFNTVLAGYNGVGRLTSLSPTYGWYGSAPANFLSNATYNAAGQITSDTLGTIESETFSYDKRMRLQSESSTLTSTSTQDYSFSLSFAPNGDVLSANDSANGNWNYSYDEFNRLVCANLASNGTCPASGTPTYSYVYDRFGNRWHQNGPLSFSATFTGNNPSSPANNNRVDGLTYDAAGNLLNDGVHNYFYDAENRLIQVDGSLGDCSSTTTLANATACYYYDANGRRVWRTGFTNDHNCGGDTTGQRGYVYDLAGHWLSSVNKVSGTGCLGEIYAGSRHVATNPGGDTTLDHTDWLGTSRVRTDWQYTSSHGFWIGQSCTSLPFGDGLDCTDANYFALHFTGKERDSESGLDNFDTRYFGSSLGRFTSPGEPLVGQYVSEPQSWNAYAYVRNNPINATDPDGQDCVYVNDNSVSVLRGDCASDTDNGIYVNGTINTNSFTYNSQTGTLGFNYTNDDTGALGVGVIAGVAPSGGVSDADRLNALSQAGNMAAPGVNLAANGLRAFGYIAGGPLLPLAECLAGDPACSKGSLALALIPGLPELKLLGLAGKEERAIGGVLKQIADGTTKGKEFLNAAGQLPGKAAGYYREFTVPVAGQAGRGAARLVTGAGGEIYYTADHYATFTRIK